MKQTFTEDDFARPEGIKTGWKVKPSSAPKLFQACVIAYNELIASDCKEESQDVIDMLEKILKDARQINMGTK